MTARIWTFGIWNTARNHIWNTWNMKNCTKTLFVTRICKTSQLTTSCLSLSLRLSIPWKCSLQAGSLREAKYSTRRRRQKKKPQESSFFPSVLMLWLEARWARAAVWIFNLINMKQLFIFAAAARVFFIPFLVFANSSGLSCHVLIALCALARKHRQRRKKWKHSKVYGIIK